MKIRTLGVVVLTALILAVAFSVSVPAASHAGNAAAVPAAMPAPVPADHPEIHDALASLRHAREHLEHAAHDFGGHRADALRATDEAIHQLEICLKFDK
ncbi:MAG: hypothetical protein ABSH13_17500 [Candidatus Acidiferrum sp.]|jgi:hypothetical protein